MSLPHPARPLMLPAALVAALVALLLGAPSAAAQAFVVQSTDDEGTGTLRDALEQEASEISFAEGLTGTIELESRLPDIPGEVTIEGPGAHLLEIRRAADAPDFRIFTVTVPTGSALTLSGVTLAGGSTPGNAGGTISTREAELAISDVVIKDSFSGRNGGAIDVFLDSSLTLERSVITDSSARQSGGAIFVTNDSTAHVVASTLTGNHVEREQGGSSGGAIASSISGTVHILSSTISSNSATSNGGGLNLAGPGLIRNSTITANSARIASNLRRFGSSEEPMPVRNTIVSDPRGEGDNCRSGTGTGELESAGFNLASDQSCPFFSEPGDQQGVDPLLGPLADNGGPTPTHVPGFGSPALDRGSTGKLAIDQRGLPRPVDLPGIAIATGGDGADVGAVELQEPPAPPPAPPPEPLADQPAQLTIGQARLRGKPRNRRVVVGGRLDPAAAGERLVIRLRTRQGQLRMRPTVGDDGRYRVNRRLRGQMRRANAGRLDVRFRGNERLRATRERVRASKRAVRLRVRQLRLRNEGRRVVVRGQVRPRARGLAVVHVKFNRANGSPARRIERTRVNKRGRLVARVNVPPAVGESGAVVSIVHRGRGPLHGQRVGRSIP